MKNNPTIASDEGESTSDSGSVSKGSNPSPAAAKARFKAGLLLPYNYWAVMNRRQPSSGYGQ